MPYLTVDTVGDEITVGCDGYELAFINTAGTSSRTFGVQNIGGTDEFGRWANNISSSTPVAGNFIFSQDEAKTTTITENTPNRVVIRTEAKFDRLSSGFDYLANTVSAEQPSAVVTYFIYPDRFVEHIEWTTTGTIDVDLDPVETRISGVDDWINTNERGISDDGAGVEEYDSGVSSNPSGLTTDLTRVLRNSSKYMGSLSDECNYITISLGTTWVAGTPPYDQYMRDQGEARYQLNMQASSISAGNHTHTAIYIIDSADRSEITPTITWTDASFSVGDLVLRSGTGYECIGAVTSGNSAVTEPAVGTDWEGYWCQCHKYTSSDRLAMAAQYKDHIIS